MPLPSLPVQAPSIAGHHLSLAEQPGQHRRRGGACERPKETGQAGVNEPTNRTYFDGRFKGLDLEMSAQVDMQVTKTYLDAGRFI